MLRAFFGPAVCARQDPRTPRGNRAGLRPDLFCQISGEIEKGFKVQRIDPQQHGNPPRQRLGDGLAKAATLSLVLAELVEDEDVGRVLQGPVALRIEKRRLASYLGMTAENLSRAMRTPNGYGVEIDGSQVRITNRKDLATFAKPTPLMDDPKC